ncbi:uncharacterized protein LOC121865881 isoform X2 [Homarus americanus]|uniref:uncharacterized protein LOC121865881 isoform X1 n=1 Tax=Homarus americanus TaxID=6706 RepID=UPI001C473F64|nr:uncharacterized protein LOC121865881 isoform X1 [Homarus americanus]XP_042221360.1 uncharacterized protein LOC121865881 isoform X2 [Homarus americanus]
MRIMAGYLTWLTWVLLLALCYTPTPAHSGSFGSAGIGGGGGNEFTLDGIHDGPWIGDDGYIGGSDADSTGPGVILRTPIQLFNSTGTRLIPVITGPPLNSRPQK